MQQAESEIASEICKPCSSMLAQVLGSGCGFCLATSTLNLLPGTMQRIALSLQGRELVERQASVMHTSVLVVQSLLPPLIIPFPFHVILASASKLKAFLPHISISLTVAGCCRWELGVEGTDLRAVMAMLGVNGEHSVTNSVAEIEKYLGIEAARKVIIQEVVKVMSAYGIQIDHRHTMLLADCMTFKVRPSTPSASAFCSAKPGVCPCGILTL